MGNSPSGRRLSDVDENPACAKHMALRVENRTGLVFLLTSFEPPELHGVLPKELAASCSIDLELDRLSSGAHAIYSSEVKIGLGGRSTEYDIIGKHQGKQQKVAGAFDLRDGRAGQFLELFVTMPRGWMSSSSIPLLACSLTQNSDNLQSVQGAASQEGRLGCCSWRSGPLLGRKGCFNAEVRVLKTDSQTMQGREALLASAEKRASITQSVKNGTLLTASSKAVAGRREASSPHKRDSNAPVAIETSREASTIATGISPSQVDCIPGDAEIFHDSVEDTIIEPVLTVAQFISASPERSEACDSVPTRVDATVVAAHVSESPPRVFDNEFVSPALRDNGSKNDLPQIYSVNPSTSAACESAMTANIVSNVTNSVTVSTAQGSQGPPPMLDTRLVSTAPTQDGSKGNTLHAKKPIQTDSCRDRDGYEIRKPNKSGAIAVQAKAEREKRKRDEIARLEQKRREEEEKRLFEANFGQIVATQDAEYHIGLMHDQLRELRIERSALLEKVRRTETDLEAASQLHRNAKVRLERYGDNPKIRAEADKAGLEETELQQTLVEAQDRLGIVEAEIDDKEALLALQAVSDD